MIGLISAHRKFNHLSEPAAKMEMEGVALALTGSIIVLTFHILTYGPQLHSASSMLRGLSFSSQEPDGLPKAHHDRVQEELWKIRARIYKNAVSLFVHPMGFLIIAFMYDFTSDFCFAGLFRLLCICGVYMTHTAVLKGVLILSRRNLTIFYIVYNASFVLFLLGGVLESRASDSRAMTMQVFNDGSRLVMTVIFMHSRTTFPAQLAMSAAESVVYWLKQEGHADHHTDALKYAVGQFVSAVGMCAVSAILEFWVISHASALLDADSMVGSFRRMLRGVCDGEVLLTENMGICEDTECLKHLLMSPTGFKGCKFEQLLMTDERKRFTSFIEQSTQEASKPEQNKTTPHCLRVSLQGTNGIRVGVDLWHVPMPDLFGKEGPHHLVALREDPGAGFGKVLQLVTFSLH